MLITIVARCTTIVIMFLAVSGRLKKRLWKRRWKTYNLICLFRYSDDF